MELDEVSLLHEIQQIKCSKYCGCSVEFGGITDLKRNLNNEHISCLHRQANNPKALGKWNDEHIFTKLCNFFWMRLLKNIQPNWNVHHNAVWNASSINNLVASHSTLNEGELCDNKYLRVTWDQTTINPHSKPSDPMNIYHPPYPFKATSTS